MTIKIKNARLKIRFYFVINFPRFTLRNHLAQAAIEAADKGDFVEARMLLTVLENPFSDKPLEEILHEFDKNGK